MVETLPGEVRPYMLGHEVDGVDTCVQVTLMVETFPCSACAAVQPSTAPSSPGPGVIASPVLPDFGKGRFMSALLVPGLFLAVHLRFPVEAALLSLPSGLCSSWPAHCELHARPLPRGSLPAVRSRAAVSRIC